MKVLHCIYSLKGGGAERQLSILASQSDAYGIESAVFCVSDEGYEQAASARTRVSIGNLHCCVRHCQQYQVPCTSHHTYRYLSSQI